MKLTEDQIKEIKEQQSQKFQTKRVTSPELEKILWKLYQYWTMALSE